MAQRTLPAESLGDEPRVVDVAGSPVLVSRLDDGTLAAYGAYCPHQGTALRQASLHDGVLTCPQHHYRYDVCSGHNIWPTGEVSENALHRMKPGHLPTYGIEERDGWLWIDEQPAPVTEVDPAQIRDAARRTIPQPDTSPEEPSGPVHHAPQAISTAQGSEFDLSLPTRVVPGHLWSAEVDGDAVTVLGQAFDPAAGGGPPTTRLRLEAAAPGTATVRCAYRRPWGGSARETRTFEVTVQPSR